jgi:transcriptional regulator with XRE-family HTH domain
MHIRTAEAIRDARRGRFTAQQLADETDRLGYPISRSQFANYESGRKQNLDICELVVTAAALSVPPLALLFPGLPDAAVNILPGHQITTAQAKSEFVGEQGLLWPGDIVGALMSQLGRLEAAMGAGMAGVGALTASARPDGWSMSPDELRAQQHRRWTPATTSPPEVRRPRPVEVQPQDVDEVMREERDLNEPLVRSVAARQQRIPGAPRPLRSSWPQNRS